MAGVDAIAAEPAVAAVSLNYRSIGLNVGVVCNEFQAESFES